MKENVYTFILDYKGGTYVSQATGETPKDALITWLKELDFQAIGVQSNDNRRILNDLDERPVPLQGMQNVWCISLIFDDTVALVNVVNTSIE